MRFPEFQMLLSMKPRMQNHIRKINGGIKTIPPKPLEIDR